MIKKVLLCSTLLIAGIGLVYTQVAFAQRDIQETEAEKATEVRNEVFIDQEVKTQGSVEQSRDSEEGIEKQDRKRIIDITTLDGVVRIAKKRSPSLFLGNPKIIYTSLLASNADCSDLNLPALPAGMSYRCVTSESDLRKTDGSGWLPVQLLKNNIIQLPIDPLNTATQNYAYITDGSGYKFWTLIESSKYKKQAQNDRGTLSNAFEKGTNASLPTGIFPDGWTGWIRVPGDSTFGTSDFYVMQYEAKCLLNGTPQKSPNTGWQTYHNGITPCTSTYSRTIASTALGYPIGYISQTDAAMYCQSIGSHLVTNKEWQTIAYNVQKNAANWSNGIIGSGFMPLGNTWSAAEEATDPGQEQYRRTNALSNNFEVWDLSGNVYEWVDDTIIGTNKPLGIDGSTVEWPTVSNFGSLTRNEVKPASDTYSYLTPSVNYIGSYYQGPRDGVIYGFVRGGRWPYGQGIEDLDLGKTPNSTHSKIGFRCAMAL